MTPGALARLTAALFFAAIAATPTASMRGPVPRQVTPPTSAPVLTGVEFLADTYDAILDAAFARAEQRLRDCTGAPPEACLVVDVVRRWWQIQLDPLNTAGDKAFLTAADAAIAAAAAWSERQPSRAEAWFYLGGAYAARAQWRVLRNDTLAAARDGKRIRSALERATTLAPTLDDAYFGIGMYQYYAAVAPTGAKILRWLLLLPGGDRDAGLAQMRRARKGRLIDGEAEYQLHLIYLWYEHDDPAALALLQSLRSAHRENPLFWRLIAEVEETYAHDVPASLQTYADLLAAAEAGGVNEVDVARVDARLGLARQLDALHETDRALATLEPIARGAAPRPYGALSRAHFQIGAAHDRLGDRAAAETAWRAAIAAAPRDDPHHVRDAVRRLQRRPVSADAAAYRLSLEGWRLLERRDEAGAARALSRAAAMAPGDPVIAYRLGRALDALDQLTNALAQYEYAIVRRDLAPPSLASSFYLHAGRVLERRGERTRAAEMYRHAADLFGAGVDARRDALQALARVQ